MKGLNAKNATSVTSVWLQARPQYRLALVLSAHHKIVFRLQLPPRAIWKGRQAPVLVIRVTLLLISISQYRFKPVTESAAVPHFRRSFLPKLVRSRCKNVTALLRPLLSPARLCGSQTDNFLATGVFKVQCHLGGVIIRLRYPYSSCRLLVCFCGYGFPVISL